MTKTTPKPSTPESQRQAECEECVTEWPPSDYKTAAATIRGCFDQIPVNDTDAITISNILDIASAGKREQELWYGDNTKSLRAALREILSTLPGMIEEAEKSHRRLRNDRFPEFARALLASTEPFRDFAKKQPSRRSWWHTYAQMLMLDVRLVFIRARKSVSFSNDSAPGIEVISNLLRLAGIEQSCTAIYEALKKEN